MESGISAKINLFNLVLKGKDGLIEILVVERTRERKVKRERQRELSLRTYKSFE